jgi:hypothetical protein
LIAERWTIAIYGQRISHGAGITGDAFRRTTGFNIWINCITIYSSIHIYRRQIMVYLAKKDGGIIHHTDLDAMKELDGIGKPDKTVTDQEWEKAGSTAYIDSTGQIVLGEPEEVTARKQEIAALEKEEADLQRELDGKDYKVIKASEAGQVLAETDPVLHARREWCRNRINEIRGRLEELRVDEAAA